MSPTVVHFVRRASAARLPAQRAVRRHWRAALAWLTMLSFVLMLGTAAAHHHRSTLEAHDCAVCSAVSDRVADLITPVALTTPVDVLVYCVAVVIILRSVPVAPRLLPRSRAPPAPSV
ncbi:MAG: hypothetical protein M3N23_06230 [Pseudomonadota bacterium]|nr:hypothetical protein [Pseudomonadota bacterium]